MNSVTTEYQGLRMWASGLGELRLGLGFRVEGLTCIP